MSTDPALITGVVAALGTLGAAIFWNRRKLNELRAWAWGRERDETDAGVAGDHRSLDEKIESIETKLDEELEARRQDHREVEREVRANRLYFAESIENLADTLNDEIDDAKIDVDVEPDWVDTDRRDQDDRSFYSCDHRPYDD